MTILESDLRLLQSVNMADVPEGGGGPSGVVIPDGASNAIFPDVSDVDRTTGRVRFRKVFAHVNTLTTEMVMGMLLTCTQPQDPQISMVLFSNNSVFDQRSDAANRVASYTFFGPVWRGMLFELHPKGIRQIRLFQPPGSEPPPVGKCLYLVQNEGLPSQISQYVQVAKVTGAEQTFYNDVSGIRQYQAYIVTCDLTTSLEYDFKGSEANSRYERNKDAAIVRDTFVGDSGSFKSSTKLSKPASVGDMTIHVNSIYAQLIPSSRMESALVNMTPAGQSTALVPAGGGQVRITTTQSFDDANIINVGGAITPGTLSVATQAGTLTDKGGQLMNGDAVVGTVRYGAGELVYLSDSIGGQKTITFKPSVPVLQITESAAIAVTAESRALNWAYTATSTITTGNVSVSYMAAGRWYTLTDDGTGVLRGADSSFGIGQVLHATNTITLNCAVLPDVGSAILFYWGTAQEYVDATPAAQQVVNAASLIIPLADVPNAAGLKLKWNDGGECTATASDNYILSGSLAGGGSVTGRLDPLAKEIVLTPTRLPPPSTDFTIEYEPKGVFTMLASAAAGDSDGVVTANIGADVMRHTVEIYVDTTIDAVPGRGQWASWPVHYRDVKKYRVRVTDDGNGNLILRTGAGAGASVGTVNYDTGAVQIHTAMQGSYAATAVFAGYGSTAFTQEPLFEGKVMGTDYLQKPGRATPADASNAVIRFIKSDLPESAKTVTLRASGLRFKLPIPDESIAQPGSLRATFGGKAIRDVGGLVLLEDVNGARTYTGG